MQIPIGDRVLDCTRHTAIMGIDNVGTDSPVAASVVATRGDHASAALDRARRQIDQGAALIDLGAHSTRSGGESPSPQEEIDRLCPVVDALVHDGILVSVDTWRADVARAVVDTGAHVLNDVSAGSDPAMAAVAANANVPLIVMHMRGRPKQHRDADQRYGDVGSEVRDFLSTRVADVQSVSGLAEATLAFNTLAAYLGVHIVRVHDVESTAHALRVVDAVRRPG